VDLFSKAIKSAATKLAPRLTSTLVQYAIADGWEPRVAKGLKVIYKDNKYQFSVNGSVEKQALAYEYGDGNRRPKGTVRRFGNLNDMAGKEFVVLFKKEL
jgi:hypothetical protein